MPLSPTEKTMWHDAPAARSQVQTDDEINSKYGSRELRIVTESNREQLPNFVAALKRPDWVLLQPFYQRRKRWDVKRKSKLIESFIMNVPVPPCFLFESEYARYEVMDGQQRITTIRDFYDNGFKLKGLEQWPELNGRQYTTLPGEIRKGLDRRSISYTVLLRESVGSDDEMLLRQQVFERLNTGGVQLESQEVRHCIYHNEFDELLVELSRHSIMRAAWGLPAYGKEEDNNPSDELLMNPHFSKMRDVEFVLRFFALRHREHYRGGMRPFLDRYMARSRRFTDDDIPVLRKVFTDTIELAFSIYGTGLFKPWNAKTGKPAKAPQIAFADAVMVGLSEFLDRRDQLGSLATGIVKATHEMVVNQPVGTFTGQGNTKSAIDTRVDSYKEMIAMILK